MKDINIRKELLGLLNKDVWLGGRGMLSYLSDETGVSLSTLYRIHRGQSNGNLDSWMKIAKYYRKKGEY